VLDRAVAARFEATSACRGPLGRHRPQGRVRLLASSMFSETETLAAIAPRRPQASSGSLSRVSRVGAACSALLQFEDSTFNLDVRRHDICPGARRTRARPPVMAIVSEPMGGGLSRPAASQAASLSITWASAGKQVRNRNSGSRCHESTGAMQVNASNAR
jgi:hypothetical protein